MEVLQEDLVYLRGRLAEVRASPLFAATNARLLAGEEIGEVERSLLDQEKDLGERVRVGSLTLVQGTAAVTTAAAQPGPQAPPVAVPAAVTPVTNATRCIVDRQEVRELLPRCEHVMQGRDCLKKKADGKLHEGCKRSATRLEELALPVAKALRALPSVATLENRRVTSPAVAPQLLEAFGNVYQALQNGMVVAERQSLDIVMAVNVGNKAVDDHRGSLASEGVTKELTKWYRKEQESKANKPKPKPAVPKGPFLGNPDKRDPPHGGLGGGGGGNANPTKPPPWHKPR